LEQGGRKAKGKKLLAQGREKETQGHIQRGEVFTPEREEADSKHETREGKGGG